MLGDYLVQLASQGAKYFTQQSVGRSLPPFHELVRKLFKKLKRAIIWEFTRPRAKCRSVRQIVNFERLRIHPHACKLFHLIQVDNPVIFHHEVFVGSNGLVRERVLSRRKIGAEIWSGGSDRGGELAEWLTDGLVQPILSWGTFQMLFYGAQKFPDYFRRLRDVIFRLFRELGQTRPRA